jgi:hypothetical protein
MRKKAVSGKKKTKISTTSIARQRRRRFAMLIRESLVFSLLITNPFPEIVG